MSDVMTLPTPRPPTAALSASVVWLPAAVLSLLPIFFSAMLFDAPGSERNVALLLIVGGLTAFPVLCGLSVAGSWGLWFFTRAWPEERALTGRRLRLAGALLPLLCLMPLSVGTVMLRLQ